MSVPIAPTSLMLLSKRCGLVNTVIRRTAAVSSRFERPASAALVSTPKPSTQHTNKMNAWQLHSFGGVEQLSLSDSVWIPMLAGPNDVLVQISTTSVNPIDLAMLGGYGNALLGCARNTEQMLCRNASTSLEFPITLGRDFVGEVVECGAQVKDFKIGDKVWGVVPPFRNGSHAQFALVSACHITKAPKNTSDVSAGGIPYAGLTAWSALWAPFAEHVWPKTQVLVLGGSGGVGSLAVQMLKAWGCQVVTTCKTDAVPVLESYGLDAVIDYTSPDYARDIKMCGPFDVILNAAGLPGTPHLDALKEWRMSRYVTISPPLLRNTDEFGIPLGAVKSWLEITTQNVTSISSKGALVQWGFFTPSKTGLKKLTTLVEEGKVKPLVHKTFKFSELPLAYQCQQDGHMRGKIVVEMGL